MCKILQLRTPAYNILALRVVNGFVTIEEGYTLLTPRQLAEFLGIKIEIVEMPDPDRRVDNRGQGQTLVRRQISPVAPRNNFTATRKYLVLYKASDDGAALPYDLYCKRVMAFVNPIVESSEDLGTSSSTSSESIASNSTQLSSSSISLSSLSSSSSSSTSSSDSTGSSSTSSSDSTVSTATSVSNVNDNSSSSSSSDLPLNILYDFGSVSPSLGFNTMYVTLAGNPGVGDDHTVVFTYPPQMSGTSPPSMVFTSLNYFNSQSSTFTINSTGSFSITYSITSVSRPGTRNGSIPFNIS